MSRKFINLYAVNEVLDEYKYVLKMTTSTARKTFIRSQEEMEHVIFGVANEILKNSGLIYIYNIINSIKDCDTMIIKGMNELYKLALQIAYFSAMVNDSSIIIQNIVRDDTKQAVKTTSDIIKKYYPFAYGKPYDKENGNLSFMLGGYALQEYIEHLAEDDFDLKKYMEDLDNEKENDND